MNIGDKIKRIGESNDVGMIKGEIYTVAELNNEIFGAPSLYIEEDGRSNCYSRLLFIVVDDFDSLLKKQKK